jgi:rhodanese-related sulfurtransferase
MHGTVHNPVAQSMFRSRLFEITGGDRNAKVVFYCNGHSCAKSYKAARLAGEFGFLAVRAYDAGIFDWTRAHPEKTVLLGQSPADPEQLIPEARFGRHLLEPVEFTEGARREDTYLIDLREPMQQGRTPDFGDKRVAKHYMAKLAERLPTDGFREQTTGKTLYIFDAAGKQVRWLQYHLERYGYSNYYFLKGGTFSIYGVASAQ